MAELIDDHPAERADDVGVVGEVDRPHLDHRVVVDEVVEPRRCPSGTRSRSCRGCAPWRRPVTTPASTRSTTASVNISVWMPRSCLSVRAMRGRRRDRADPELERRAVRDELGDVLADPPLDVADRRAGVLVRRDVDLDGEVDVVDVDEAVAERPRHRPVELDDDRLRGPDGGVHRLDARAERAEAVRVGRRGVDEHDVERQRAGSRTAAGRPRGRPARSRRGPR